MIKSTCSCWILWILASALLFGCIERELPVPAREPGLVNLAEANLGVDYDTQLFYSLTNNRVESSCQQKDWCVALRSGSDSGSTYLMVNSSRAMKTHRTESTNLDLEIDLENMPDEDWEVMDPTGSVSDSTSSLRLLPNELVMLDLGYNEGNVSIGIARIALIDIQNTHWTLHIADADGANADTIEVSNRDGYTWNQASILNRIENQIEPPTEDWEICITQYMELLDGEIPYLVVGILTPTSRVSVYETSNVDWDLWKTNDWTALEFSEAWNTIGYDWKSYDLSTGAYEIDFDKLFCIKTEEGREFLMRMLDFYDENGNKGNVTFEVLER